MRVQCDKCSKRMRRVEHLCRRVAFSSGMDSKTPHATTCTTSNATSVAHLLLLLPLPPLPPFSYFPIPFPKAISHRRTLAPSLQPGTLCRVARGVGLSFFTTRRGGGRGGEVVGLLVALLRHLRSPPGKRLPAALSKEGLQQSPRLVEASSRFADQNQLMPGACCPIALLVLRAHCQIAGDCDP
jgi:hypothetical protein